MEHNALLLKVITHDLLSPLTATKWYAELLAQGGVAADKQREYLTGIADAANLGISITKHVHIAGKVLTSAYTPEASELNLPEEVQKAVQDLAAQYARHGVAIAIELDPETQKRILDRELLGLLVWAVAKYFLAAAPAGSTVSFRGLSSVSGDRVSYSLIVSLAGIPDRAERVKQFSNRTPTGSLDQAFVFAELVHEATKTLDATATLGTQGNLLVFEASFM